MKEVNLLQVTAIEDLVSPHPWRLSQFRESLDCHHCLVISDDKGVIGFLVYSQVAGEAEILNIAVHPNYQRKGLARQLLNHCLSHLPEEVDRLFLEVRASNSAAIHLYGQLGFVQSGCRKNYYLLKSGQREDALLMSLNRGL